jgi:hypothetical protein
MGGEFRLDPCGGVGLGEVDRQHQRPRTSCRGDFVCHEAAQLDHAEQLSMIDVNIRFLTELSLAFVDTLSRRRGGILNVGSVAGFLPGPGMAVRAWSAPMP